MARKDRRSRDLPPREPSPQALAKAEEHCALVRDGSHPGAPYVAPPQAVEAIRRWASAGKSIAWIAQALKINHETLTEIRKRQPEVDAAIIAGKAIHEDELAGVLHDAAVTSGNIIAAMFLLKARYGWREGDVRDGAGANVNVVITMPGAMTPDQYIANLPKVDAVGGDAPTALPEGDPEPEA